MNGQLEVPKGEVVEVIKGNIMWVYWINLERYFYMNQGLSSHASTLSWEGLGARRWEGTLRWIRSKWGYKGATRTNSKTFMTDSVPGRPTVAIPCLIWKELVNSIGITSLEEGWPIGRVALTNITVAPLRNIVFLFHPTSLSALELPAYWTVRSS